MRPTRSFPVGTSSARAAGGTGGTEAQPLMRTTTSEAINGHALSDEKRGRGFVTIMLIS